MISIIIVNIWRGVPFFAISLLAGLQTISPELSEAAAIDGAKPWQQFWHITWPLLLPVTMSKAGLDNRHRNKDGEISEKYGNTLVRTLRKIYGQGFAAGYPETTQLSEVMLQLNETSLSQLRRDHETHHLKHKIARVAE